MNYDYPDDSREQAAWDRLLTKLPECIMCGRACVDDPCLDLSQFGAMGYLCAKCLTRYAANPLELVSEEE